MINFIRVIWLNDQLFCYEIVILNCCLGSINEYKIAELFSVADGRALFSESYSYNAVFLSFLWICQQMPATIYIPENCSSNCVFIWLSTSQCIQCFAECSVNIWNGKHLSMASSSPKWRKNWTTAAKLHFEQQSYPPDSQTVSWIYLSWKVRLEISPYKP